MPEADAQKQMAAALGSIASGLFVVTVCQGARATGMLASWIQQCSFDPPQISIAIRRDRDIQRWLTDGAAFTVNILDAGQTDMIVHFGRGYALDEDAFKGLEVSRPDGVAPVLDEAHAYLDCRVTGRMPAGDHDLFLGRMVAGRVLGAGQPMIHVRKSGMHY